MRIWSCLLIAGCAAAVAGCGTTIYEVPGVREIGKIAGHKGTAEEQVTAVLNDIARSIETRKVDRILAHISPKYADGWGRNRSAVEEYIRDTFRKYWTIKVTRVAPAVKTEGEQAQVVETFGVAAEPRDTAKEPPVNMEGRLAVRLERVDGKWMIVECRFM